jgi:hypothetical protein
MAIIRIVDDWATIKQVVYRRAEESAIPQSAEDAVAPAEQQGLLTL